MGIPAVRGDVIAVYKGGDLERIPTMKAVFDRVVTVIDWLLHVNT